MSAIRLVSTGGDKSFGPSEASRVPPSRLINRAQFLDRVARELARTKHSLADRYTVLYVDIDRFKVVSGSLGRQTGDHLLSAIASRIGAPLTRQDAFASTQARDLFDLETDLRRAVERDEFELHYQPVVSMTTGRVRAFEALLRWRHPVRGLQCPATFLPLLKETGLILAVGRWVIQEACVQAKKWEELRGRPVPVTINLAPQQFTHASVVDVVAEAIGSSGVHPGAVILEITEDALIEDLASARATLLPLRDWGIRTLIDDFGTGYSSLSYLRQLPIDGIKIDASFVDRMERYAEDRLIVRAVVALAHALDLCVVAEGIERPEQLRELRNLECEEGQGYMISLPVDAATAAGMVAGNWVAALE